MNEIADQFRASRSGAASIEYGLLCAFMALAVIAAAAAYSGSLRDAYSGLGTSISDAGDDG